MPFLEAILMLVLAHRGMGKGRYENTLKSFEEGLSYGAHGIELDVRLTKDGAVILNHDPDLNRTMGLDVKLSETTLAELDKMGLIGFDSLTTLETVYKELPEETFIDVEIKAVEAVPQVIKIIKRFDAVERTMFSSFHHDCLLAFTQEFFGKPMIAPIIDKEIRQVGGEEYLTGVIKKYKPYSANLNKDLFEYLGLEKGLSMLRKVREGGTRISLWTLNDPNLLLKVREVCDFLITDCSDKMMEVL